MSAEKLHFNCPGCGQKKVWNTQYVGKRAQCGCGQILTVPEQPISLAAAPVSFEEAMEAAAAMEASAEYVLSVPATSGATAARSTAFVPPPVVIEREEADGSVSRVGPAVRPIVRSETAALPYRKGLQREEKPAAPEVSVLRDYILPAILIIAGVAICLVDGMYQGDGGWKPLSAVAGSVIISMIGSLALAVGAVFAASAMGGIAFQEPLPIVIYKLCAAALAPGAVGSLALHWIGGINGDMAGVFIGLSCYFLLFMLLFRLAFSDQVVCVMLLFIIRTGVAYMIFKMQGAKHGSEI